jgi:cell division protein FtsN
MVKTAKNSGNGGNKSNGNTERRTARHGGSTFLGILIGLVLGLAIALAVAWYINRLPNPWKEKPPATKSEAPTTRVPMKAESAKEAPATKSADLFPATKPDSQQPPARTEDPAADKSDPDKKSTAAAREAFYLQAGSFQNANEADSLKARLALLGLEASIQARNLPEKGVWHRVRVGPYADVDELNRIRDVLRQNNIDAALVKVREAEK